MHSYGRLYTRRTHWKSHITMYAPFFFFLKAFHIILRFAGTVYMKVLLTLRIKKDCVVCSSKEHLCGQR